MNESTSKVQPYIDQAIAMAIEYGPKLLLAILVLIIGLWVIGGIVKGVGKLMSKRGLDPSVQPFLKGLMGWLLKAMLFISVASMFGVETTSFVAVLGALGLAVGLALQGSLANFAGGVLILLFKPFGVGDRISAQGETGDVQSITIFNTIIKTADGKTIIMPNGAVSNGNITNWTKEGRIRCELTIGVGYESDIKKTKQVITEVLNSQSGVMKDPAPMAAVSELADSSVNFAVHAWCTVGDYWDVYFGLHERIKEALDANNINIPYPHVQMLNQ